MTTLQAQTSEPAADRVTATPEAARDLRGALSPEFFEQRYVFHNQTHGRHHTADCQLQASLSLVFVRLAHDRRLVGMVLFKFPAGKPRGLVGGSYLQKKGQT